MPWKAFPAFTSSNISTARYDEERLILEVAFNSGGIYHYFDVPIHVINEFMSADSKGKFLAARIKGHYRYSKI